LCDVGHQLYDQLLPQALQDLAWTFCQRGVQTVLVLSDEPHIPWELIKPYRVDPATGAFEAEGDFWGEAFALTHWLRGRPPVPLFSVRRVLVVAAGGNGGPASQPTVPRDMVAVAPGGAPANVSELSSVDRLPAVNEELALLRSLENSGAQVQVLPPRRRELHAAF
jgi:hypothetical protein